MTENIFELSREELIEKHVLLFLDSDFYKIHGAPIIAFNHDDCEIITAILKLKEIQIKKILHEKFDYQTLRHFPYKCNEVKFEHNKETNIWNCEREESHGISRLTRTYLQHDIAISCRYIIKLRCPPPKECEYKCAQYIEDSCYYVTPAAAAIETIETQKPKLHVREKAKLRKMRDKEKTMVKQRNARDLF
jgi:hypothetical protein